MRRSLSAAALLMALLCLPSPAQGAFGLKGLDFTFTAKDGSPAMQAGGHPFAITTSFETETLINSKGKEAVDGAIKDLDIFAIPGLVAEPEAVPPCAIAEFLNQTCAPETAVGYVTAEVSDVQGKRENPVTTPIFSLLAAPGTIAKIGFWLANVPNTVSFLLDTSPPYNGIAASRNTSQVAQIFDIEVTLWGNPADPSHDPLRDICAGTPAADSCPANFTTPRPFFTTPRSCLGPQKTLFRALAWWTGEATDPGPPALFEGQAETHDDSVPPNPLGFTGCGALPFDPTIDAQPTTLAAQSPSGLDFDLDVADEGITDPDGLAASDIRKAVVTLPQGMSANPSLAEGLEVCTTGQLALESPTSAPGAGCPQASKIGTVEVQTPLLSEPVNGTLYIAEPYENQFGSLLALYMVIKNANLGVIVKQALKVEPDPVTGQLRTIADEIPQLPFSHLRMHLRAGARSPLISPPTCGSHVAIAELTPWAGGPVLNTTSTFQVISGSGGSPCPSGTAPFHPGFQAGTLNNAAKSFSPFYMRLTRADGEQDMSRFSATLPPGVAGIIAGLGRCPEASIAAAKARTGPHGAREELADPSCPASSRIGRTLGGAGVGSQLTYVPGSLYLAGPMGGDPLSVVSITPAMAGPFDAGVVVVREALALDPVSGKIEVDGSQSDPIPHVLKGIPLNVRDLRVYADRDHFTFNATSCEPSLTKATLFGAGTALLPTGESAAGLSARYQAADCSALGFKPKLAIQLRGGTERGGHPALRAIVTPRPKDANFAKAVTILPRSAFLDQGHIRTICTRVQFAAGEGNGANCPRGARYGFAKAWSPILEKPAEGPVFLRSSSHNLPDLVIALQGPPEAAAKVELSARIDSIKGGIRPTFSNVPDLPVSRFVLDMQGGAKGLIINSTNLCRGTHRAKADLTGQNGRASHGRPEVKALGCSGATRARR